MARTSKGSASEPVIVKKGPPELTPEDRDQLMINLAYELTEKHLREGTATSQEITHFLKLGSMREQIEVEKLRKENILLETKAKAIQSEQRSEELIQEALDAWKKYSGGDNE